MNKIDELSVAAIRSTAIDMIHAANSGHPGMALGSAPMLYVLFSKHIVADPYDPTWSNRDRFVLSAGHASSLLYVMLHLCGYNLTMDDLKKFRQLNSLTPGHPEYLHTSGVDATSGPLGQGIAQAVGMALAEKNLHASLSDEHYINHYTYCLCGDGCLEEGLSQESITFAGTYKLNKLILLYDRNDVTLDGPLANSSNEDVKKRFEASNWNVITVEDGNDLSLINSAIKKAKKSDEKPTLIIVHTIIGYGSMFQGTHKVHGSPLKDDDIIHAKEVYGYTYPPFTIPHSVYKNFARTFIKRGKSAHTDWILDTEKFRKNPQNENIEFLFKNEITKFVIGHDKTDFSNSVEQATRKSSELALNYYSQFVPNLIGGSADVAGSVLTNIKTFTTFSAENPAGRQINFGIREFLMASIANGILLHGGLRPFVGCFLVFSDYMKSAIRMSALSKLPVIYIFSHDSISVGEDGPTHEPIEQLAMLRSIPNVNVIRPCDERETYAAYKVALESKTTPTCIITTRHGLPLIDGSSYDGVSKGGYIVSKEQKKVDFTIIADGSEVSLAIEAQKALLAKGIDTRVVSLPSFYLFDKQTEEYKENVFGTTYEKRIYVEMLSSFGLYKYAKNVMSIDEFGRSAPFADIRKYFDFTSERLAKTIEDILK
jgi:transketolase